MKIMKHMKQTGSKATKTQLDVLMPLFLRDLQVLHGEILD